MTSCPPRRHDFSNQQLRQPLARGSPAGPLRTGEPSEEALNPGLLPQALLLSVGAGLLASRRAALTASGSGPQQRSRLGGQKKPSIPLF